MRDFAAFANAQAPVNGTAGNITSWGWRAWLSAVHVAVSVCCAQHTLLA